ncbi:MAG: damage-inducible protein DinB [Alphaproteobacteria bacterium]|nr:damage-inducible protein DinB [Alphaproteobacteria bacterium]
MELEYFRQLARYNQWANRTIYAACAKLHERDYMQPRASFFGSIHATLNHILVGDRIWMGRFTGNDPGITALNQILYGDFVGLRVAREAEDAQIIHFVDGLDLPTVNTTLRYKTLSEPRKSMSSPMRITLGHFFNHQTHHRGQAHGLLSQTEVPPPSLDLIAFVRAATPAA